MHFDLCVTLYIDATFFSLCEFDFVVCLCLQWYGNCRLSRVLPLQSTNDHFETFSDYAVSGSREVRARCSDDLVRPNIFFFLPTTCCIWSHQCHFVCLAAAVYRACQHLTRVTFTEISSRLCDFTAQRFSKQADRHSWAGTVSASISLVHCSFFHSNDSINGSSLSAALAHNAAFYLLIWIVFLPLPCPNYDSNEWINCLGNWLSALSIFYVIFECAFPFCLLLKPL